MPTRIPARLSSGLIGGVAVLFGVARLVPGSEHNGPVLTAAAEFVTNSRPATARPLDVTTALAALSSTVRSVSHPFALESAFRGYFAYKAAHPKDTNPYLYFVDYGLPSTAPRGYVFDMKSLAIVEGPFTVAHGRGSSVSQYGVPTRFTNASGSATSSLGLFVARETYAFSGKSGGKHYTSVGLRLAGLSSAFNDRALARGVVAHGAPYVTAKAAGRSEGCPAMEQERAKRLLPKLANGGVVFLFAPDADWMAKDPWIASGAP
jgi:hypothetical protein